MSAPTSAPSAAAPERSVRDRVVGGPTAVLGLLAGAAAALVGIAVCAAVGLVGWYLSDAGGHGAPRSGVLAGTRAWLVAHGAGLEVRGVAITLLPLGITVLLAWVAWQGGLRLGELVWNHGPTDGQREDGARDLTVPVAVGGFTLGYVVVAAAALALSSGDGWDGAFGPVLKWSLFLSVVVAGSGVAFGSGRLELWLEPVPWAVRDAVSGAGALLVGWLAVSLLLFVAAMVVGLGDAADAVDRLDTSRGETFLLALACVVLVPHAVLFSSAFLLGPGFAVGTGTAVAPSGVLLGPLPLVPILGALPDEGEPAGFWVAHLAVPVLVALVVVARRQVRLGVARWDSACLVGVGAGAGAAVVLGLLTTFARGAAGPGRMADVGAPTGEVLVAALTPFVLGGLVGALAGTWWVRRSGVPEEQPDGPVEEQDGLDETWAGEPAAAPQPGFEPQPEPEPDDVETTVEVRPVPAPDPEPEVAEDVDEPGVDEPDVEEPDVEEPDVEEPDVDATAEVAAVTEHPEDAAAADETADADADADATEGAEAAERDSAAGEDEQRP